MNACYIKWKDHESHKARKFHITVCKSFLPVEIGEGYWFKIDMIIYKRGDRWRICFMRFDSIGSYMVIKHSTDPYDEAHDAIAHGLSIIDEYFEADEEIDLDYLIES